MKSADLTEASPSAASELYNFNPSLHLLQRRVYSSTHALRSHLLSIVLDSEVVQEIQRFIEVEVDADVDAEAKVEEEVEGGGGRALFAMQPNKRNGLWYVPGPLSALPSRRPPSTAPAPAWCYFKSTDGHGTPEHWKFSLSRLNLHTLTHIFSNEGTCIVDSTRRGKRFPDSLTVTVPVWCAVMNMILLARQNGQGQVQGHYLTLPPWTSRSATYKQRAGECRGMAMSCQCVESDVRG